MEQQGAPKRIKLTGLWESVDKDGHLSMSGTLGSSRLTVRKNTFKTAGSNAPDFTLYLEERPQQQAQASPDQHGYARQQGTAQHYQAAQGQHYGGEQGHGYAPQGYAPQGQPSYPGQATQSPAPHTQGGPAPDDDIPF